MATVHAVKVSLSYSHGLVTKHIGLVVPGCSTIIVRCKNVTSQHWRLCISHGSPTTYIYIGRAIPEHVKEPRAPVDKGKALKPGTTGQIPQLLRLAVKLYRHQYR